MTFRRYNLVLTVLMAVALAVVAAANLAADPYGAYPAVHIDKIARHSGQVGTRTARAELLRHGPWEFVILGSSRAQMGYAPDHPALAGLKGCNAALPGTNIRELQPILNYTLRHNDPKRILLGMDFLLFTDTRKFNQDFMQSRFAPGRDLISYHLDNTVSLRATYASEQTILSFARHEDPRFTPYGQTVRHSKRLAGGHRKLFHDKLIEFFTNPESYANFHYSQDRLDRFANMIRAARESDTKLDIVINPVHAAQFEAIAAAGLWPTFEQWLTDITRIVHAQQALPGGDEIRLVSFLGYGPYSDEPIPAAGDTETTMQWWWECSHFKDALGRLVLDRLYGEDSKPGFGLDLTPDTVEAHIASLRAGRDAWRTARPGDAAFVHEVAREAGIED